MKINQSISEILKKYKNKSKFKFKETYLAQFLKNKMTIIKNILIGNQLKKNYLILLQNLLSVIKEVLKLSSFMMKKTFLTTFNSEYLINNNIYP